MTRSRRRSPQSHRHLVEGVDNTGVDNTGVDNTGVVAADAPRRGTSGRGNQGLRERMAAAVAEHTPGEAHTNSEAPQAGAVAPWQHGGFGGGGQDAAPRPRGSGASGGGSGGVSGAWWQTGSPEAGGSAPSSGSSAPEVGSVDSTSSSNPAALPTCAAPPAVQLPALDPMVDPYMDARWDRSEYDALCAVHGPPRSLTCDPQELLDRHLPSDLSAGARTAVRVGAAFAFGGLDHAALRFVAPAAVEAGVGALGAVQHLAERGSLYCEADAGLLAAVDLGATLAGGLLGTADTCIGAARGAVDKLDAVARLAEVSAGAAPVAAGQTLAEDTVQSALVAAQAVCRGVQGTLDTTVAVAALMQARESEEAGDFAQGEAFRELARDEALAAIEEQLALAASLAVELCPGVDVLTGGVGAIVWGVEQGTGLDVDLAASARAGGRSAMDELVDVPEVIDLVASSNERILRGEGLRPEHAAQAAHELQSPLHRAHDGSDRAYVRHASSLEGSAEGLTAARARTHALLGAAGERLSADPPDWCRGRIEAIEGDEGPELLELTQASVWITLMLQWSPGLAEELGGMGASAAASGLEALGDSLASGPLSGLEDHIETLLEELPPALEGARDRVDSLVAEQAERMAGLREVTARGREQLETLRCQGSAAEQVDAAVAPLRDRLTGLRLDAAGLACPPLLSLEAASELVAPVNAAVDAALQALESGLQASAEAVDAQVQAIVAELEARLARLEAALEDSGTLQQELEARGAWLKDQLGQVAELARSYQGQVRLDPLAGAAALRGVASALRESPAAEAPEVADPWRDLLVDRVVPEYLAWKQAHEADLAEVLHPAVPAWELAAAEEAARSALSGPISPEQEAEIEAALDQCAALAGSRGKDALLAFWAAVDRLAVALGATPAPSFDRADKGAPYRA